MGQYSQVNVPFQYEVVSKSWTGETIPDRGALYIIWGDIAEHILERSLQSLRKYQWEFLVIRLGFAQEGHLGVKSYMYELSPFKETVFLDYDTVLLLDVFPSLHQKLTPDQMAVALAPACLVRRYGERYSYVEFEYNTGVVVFNRGPKLECLFSEWVARSKSETQNDQIQFSEAITHTGFNPVVLPKNFNYRPAKEKTVFGPIFVWHSMSNPPANIEEWNMKELPTFGERSGGDIIPSVKPDSSRQSSLANRLIRSIFSSGNI